MKVRSLFFAGFLGIFCVTAFADEAVVSNGKFPVGERMLYSIKYMGISIGKSEGFIKEIVSIQGRKAYHIIVRVKSNPIVDVIYKVRGEHHTYIDVEKLHSLRYEVWGGKKEPDYTLNFDQKNRTVEYHFLKQNKRKIFKMDKNSQDQVSLAYLFRTLPLEANSKYAIPVHADSKQWKIEIRTHEIKKSNFQKKEVKTIQFEPKLDFINALVKKGKVTGEMTFDERRIPINMQVKVPMLGAVKAHLIQYTTDPNTKSGFDA